MPDSKFPDKLCDVLHQQPSEAMSQAASQTFLENANAAPAAPVDLASSAPHASVLDATAAKGPAGNPLHDAQQLLAAAERMLRESCGEDWLLQPFIPDMGSNEYRCSSATAMFFIGSPAKCNTCSIRLPLPPMLRGCSVWKMLLCLFWFDVLQCFCAWDLDIVLPLATMDQEHASLLSAQG